MKCFALSCSADEQHPCEELVGGPQPALLVLGAGLLYRQEAFDELTLAQAQVALSSAREVTIRLHARYLGRAAPRNGPPSACAFPSPVRLILRTRFGVVEQRAFRDALPQRIELPRDGHNGRNGDRLPSFCNVSMLVRTRSVVRSRRAV